MQMINEEQNYLRLKENQSTRWNWKGHINETWQIDWDWQNTQAEREPKYKTQNQKIKPTCKIYWNYQTVLSYCLKCKNSTESKNSKAKKTTNGKITFLSNSALWNCKKSSKRQAGEPIRNQNSFEHYTIIGWLFK